MPAYPTLIAIPDSSKFTVSTTDPAMRAETDGGYTITRPRFKRKPPLVFKFGYTRMSDLDKQTLLDFYNDVAMGGSLIFDWLNPEDGKTYAVRFKEAIDFSYVGIGTTKLWNCLVTVEQA